MFWANLLVMENARTLALAPWNAAKSLYSAVSLPNWKNHSLLYLLDRAEIADFDT
jgi:hypothetical protein